MILIVGGTKGAGKVCAEMLEAKGHEVSTVGRNNPVPATIPQAIAFYQRDRENEFAAGVEATRRIFRNYLLQGMTDANIVLIGSTSIHEDDGSPPQYRMTKTAMLAIVRQWAKIHTGMRINMVSPGDFRQGPMKAEDVAEAVIFLLHNRFITGQEIVVRA